MGETLGVQSLQVDSFIQIRKWRNTIMARATTKNDLVIAANAQFEKLWKIIDGMTEAQQDATFDFGDTIKQKEAHWKRDKNLRDVLVHLYEWHQLLLNWVTSNQKGEGKPFLPAPYNWKTYMDMNVEFWKKHQETPLEEAKKMLGKSHKDVMKMIDGFVSEDLFAKGALKWTGTSTLGAYCVSATASHYDWAMKKLRVHVKSCKGS